MQKPTTGPGDNEPPNQGNRVQLLVPKRSENESYTQFNWCHEMGTWEGEDTGKGEPQISLAWDTDCHPAGPKRTPKSPLFPLLVLGVPFE